MPSKKPIRVGCIGLGGFAGAPQDEVFQLEDTGVCKQICMADPKWENFDDLITKFRMKERGIKFFHNYIDMLDECKDSLDLVIAPTPVPLHAEMHKACVDRGLPLYLEKPPCLFYEEMDQMLEVEKQAKKLTNVGFGSIVHPERRALKRRILDGDFGELREVTTRHMWARRRTYFDNSYWKGRLLLEDGRPVLESCFGNAMSHPVHSCLFWAGSNGVYSWAEAAEVESELYRANDIDSTDSLFVRAKTTNGRVLRIATTVTYDGPAYGDEQLVLDKASISFEGGSEYLIKWNDGRVESVQMQPASLRENLLTYMAYLRGEMDRPLNPLADCAPFVRFYNLAIIAGNGIHTIPEQYLTREDADTNELVAVPGIGDLATAFVTEGKWPSDLGIPWARPGGRAVASDLPKLRAVITDLLEQRKSR